MKVTISFKHLDHTPALDERIHQKSQKLAKYFNGNTKIEWTCFVKEGNHHAEVSLKGPHFRYHASAHTDSMYKSFDQVVGKIEKQLSKKKGKWKNQIHKSQGAEIVIMDPEEAWASRDTDKDYEDVA